MRYFLIRETDGDSYVAWKWEGCPEAPAGCPDPIEVPRLPEAHEHWDVDQGRFVRNDEAAIDELHGQEAIIRAHITKAIEADLILSGMPVNGLLAAEAAATGQDLTELARKVAAKAIAAREAEVARVTAKQEARARVESA